MELHDVGLFSVRTTESDDPWWPKPWDPCLDCWTHGRSSLPAAIEAFLLDGGSEGNSLDLLLRPVGADGCPHGGAS